MLNAPLVKVAVLHDEIARLEVDFLQLTVFAGVNQVTFTADHEREVDAVGAVVVAEHLLGCEGQVRKLVVPPDFGGEIGRGRFEQVTRLHHDARLAFGTHNSSHLHFVVSFES